MAGKRMRGRLVAAVMVAGMSVYLWAARLLAKRSRRR